MYFWRLLVVASVSARFQQLKLYSCPPVPSQRTPHFCSNNMENPGERRKTTEEMGQAQPVSSPPLTTDKQHRPRGSEMRLKTPRNDTPCLSLCGKTENNAYLYVKCEFSCNMGFCFSTLGSPRLP